MSDRQDAGFWELIDRLISESDIVIDRPKGTAHPRYPGMIYPADYGYLRGTASMDGEGIDVFAGSGGDRCDAVICTVDAVKRDSEIKLLIGCTQEEKDVIYDFLSGSPYMKCIMIDRDPE